MKHPQRVALALSAVLWYTLLIPAAMGTETHRWPMTPNRQEYATAWGANPFQDDDLHVSLIGGRPHAVSYISFDLDELPSTARVVALDMTLVQNESAGHNVETTGQPAGTLLACLAVGDFPTQFDPSTNDLPWDCSRLSTPARPVDPNSWSVDLLPFIAQWGDRGQGGAVLVGAVADEAAADSWAMGFDRRRTIAQVAYTLPGAVSAGDELNELGGQAAAGFVVSESAFFENSAADALLTSASPIDNTAVRPAEQASPSSPNSASPPLSVFAFVAIWSAAVALLVVGAAMKLRVANTYKPRALAKTALGALRQKSTWAAGLPLLLIVVPGGVVFGYALQMNQIETPPLTFPDLPSAPDAPDALPADVADPVSQTAESVDAPTALASADPTPVAATPQPGATHSGTFDGQWVVVGGTVAGYTWNYSSPTGPGTRVGRTNGSDGVTGQMVIDGDAVRVAKFSVEMSKVHCDGGQACTDHVNEIMDVENHPFETFALTAPIQVPASVAEGQQVSRTVTGDFRLRGVTRTATFTLTGRHQAGRIEILGSIPVRRSDYNVPDAGRPGFALSKEGTMDVLLVLKRA